MKYSKTKRRSSAGSSRRRRPSSSPRSHAHVETLLAATRLAYTTALSALGQRAPSREEIEEAIYIDKRGAWLVPPGSGILISYETGLIPSPSWDEWGMDLEMAATKALQALLKSKKFYIQDLNAALATVVGPNAHSQYITVAGRLTSRT